LDADTHAENFLCLKISAMRAEAELRASMYYINAAAGINEREEFVQSDAT